MQPTLTSRERQLELEQSLHRDRNDPVISRLLELLTIYSEKTTHKLVWSDSGQEVNIGRLRALGEIMKTITQGPTTIDSLKKGV